MDGFSSKKMKIDFFYFFLKAQDLCQIRKAGDFYMKVIIFRFMEAPAIRLALNPSCLCFPVHDLCKAEIKKLDIYL